MNRLVLWVALGGGLVTALAAAGVVLLTLLGLWDDVLRIVRGG